MILNTGVRTDTIQYFTPWLLKRFEEGYVLSRNPMFQQKVTRYELTPEKVDCVVFCSKNYKPILKDIVKITDKFNTYFYYTITAYEKDVEPGVPSIEESIKDEVTYDFVKKAMIESGKGLIAKYNFDEEVMIALFGYCFDKSALHRNYIQTVAEAWAKNNIRTFTDLDMYYEKQEKLNLIANTISKKLSLKRNLSQYEYAYVEKWVIDFKYNLDIIEIALKRTTSKANPSFDYLDKLLSDWHDRGFTTTEEIQKFLLEMKEKNKNVQNLEKTAGYNKYEQRSYDNLNNLYANVKKKQEA